jgi:RNA polymerase sigma-70 factor (ECF subfamily)
VEVPEWDERRLRSGDQEAARQLVERLYPLVSRIVRSHLPRGVAAEDWEQEAFVRILSKIDQYRGEAPFEHWVARVVVNTCLDQLRKRRRAELRWSDLGEQEVEMLQQSLARPAGAEQSLAARDLVGRMLDSLPAEDRVVVQLLDLEQKSVAEVAALLGRGESWVKVRAFRARKKLAAIISRLDNFGP